MSILSELFALRDEKYAAFQAKLTPGVPLDSFIGVRVPNVRALAKKYAKTTEAKAFLSELPHKYYDENMLHALLVSEIRDFDACIAETERFLPYVDNWAVCDIFSPRIFAKHKPELLVKIREWAKSDRVYTCRFGIEMLMSHFLDADFKAEDLEIPAAVQSDEYYVNMMIAWYFATALTKQWDAAVPYIENRRLPLWVHRKTISKACESYLIPDDRKQYLKTLK